MGGGWNDFEAARISLAKLELSAGDSSLERVLEDATGIIATALSVDRVGVWIFEDDRAQMRCIWQHDAHAARSNIPVLRAIDYPLYMQALEEHRFIVADDALTHPHTRGLRQDYLEPLGITSMLDAPVYRGNEIIGIVCHEHTAPARHWSDAERVMAATVADVIALVFEQARRIKAEQELAETRAKLRELVLLDDVARVVANTAHDLNNLLTMLGASIALSQAQAGDAEAVRRSSRDMNEVVSRAAVLVQRLIGLKRESERVPVTLDLSELVQQLAPVLRALLGSEHALVLDLPLAKKVMVLAQRLALEQAIVNLVTNARQASVANGSVEVSVSTTERDQAGVARPFAVIQVRDSGVGMTEEVKNAALEPFFTTRSTEGGSGFGLHIVETVARRAGGFVEIDSALGRGTTVRILLPESR